MKQSGLIVITKKGTKGRTFNDQALIKGKIAVYPEMDGQPYKYEEKAILCDPKTLTTIGFID